jgi:hypothetical protein
MTRQSYNGRVQGLFPARRHFVSQRIGDQLDLLVCVSGARPTAFAQLYRHKPVHVGVLQRSHELARAALAARFLARCFAMDQLGKPQRETLLPYATRTDKQERLRQLSGGVGARQFGLNPFVPDEGR